MGSSTFRQALNKTHEKPFILSHAGRGLNVDRYLSQRVLTVCPQRATLQRTSTSPQTANSSEAALLGVAGYATDKGLSVTSVRAGSPAEQIGIKPGDVVSKIDGQQVHSSHDIESAIGANPNGTVKVSYLILGAWLTEREAKVR